jgi:hypothetical protein
MVILFRRIVQKLSRDFEIKILIKKGFAPNADYFSKIYAKQLFGRSESASGPGSSLDSATTIIDQLPPLLAKFSIKTIADIPCGDLNWIQKIDLAQIGYSGFDIVPDLIDSLKVKYPDFSFKVFDATSEVLSKKDLIICRDLFVHLTLEQSHKALLNFKNSGSKYLLSTTFTEVRNNKELVVPKIGVGWRPLNLEIAPFNLGKPVVLINEDTKEGRGKYTDKCLGLWEIN